MTKAILDQAQQRGMSLPYAGAVTPQEAFQLLESDTAVQLIDVRTNAERDWVGQVQINPAQLHAVQWNLYPTKHNADFLSELAAQVADKETVLLFLCRSGVRSRSAAQLATEHGYTQCYDILEGFEGDKDQHGHRKAIAGWCHAGLPWRGA
ncbi:rhodanese-like domain-containing protein [Solimicrobium silvestre]|uniref:Rhodanese-like domain n=1 Tax=Solimicrobium silvestre TaxID=2099400 RepID=A0A2S9GZ03_9BURK|nr:rhodanese-like domain-containing protein [Solimicrobium silvestre]PRC92951.1 Rhodanese-like domain [Solimicrobium silvestre]